MILIGLGVGPTLSGLTILVQGSVDSADIGAASSNLTFFRQIGGSVALAIAGAVYSGTLSDTIDRGLHQAQASATATVMPWLSFTGALAVLIAVLLLPPSRRRTATAAGLDTAVLSRSPLIDADQHHGRRVRPDPAEVAESARQRP